MVEETRTRGTVCNEAANQPTVNVLSEAYGSGSRCIEHGTREWTNNMYTGFSTGSGCYQVMCSLLFNLTKINFNHTSQHSDISQYPSSYYLAILVSGVKIAMLSAY